MPDAAVSAPSRGLVWPPACVSAALLPIAAALILYTATIATLARTLWGVEDHAYSPFVLVAAGWLAWRTPGLEARPDRWAPAWAALFLLGLTVQFGGRLLGNLPVEAGSALLVAPGLIGWLAGSRTVRRLVYPLLALAFAVPLPGSLVVALTFPLKMMVSKGATAMLTAMGLPVAREGVIIDIGSYRLLVADACSGLQSMYGLAASAVIYLALAGPRSPVRAIALLVAVVPIAFAANVLRVVVLAVITHQWGEAAGQGFLHGFAGILMFAVAFAGLMIADALFDRIGRRTA